MELGTVEEFVDTTEGMNEKPLLPFQCKVNLSVHEYTSVHLRTISVKMYFYLPVSCCKNKESNPRMQVQFITFYTLQIHKEDV